ncbi:MAG: hypothetical protein JWQ98_2255 [Chlorobi bacterium]|nr:hypothetical protein [Chlorobiota bacterium]
MKKAITIAFAALLFAGCGKNYKGMTIEQFAKEGNVKMAPADSTALVNGIAKYTIAHPDTVGLSAKKVGDLMEDGKK